MNREEELEQLLEEANSRIEGLERDLQASKNDNDDSDYSITRKNVELETKDRTIRRLEGELTGKQFELDQENRKRKQAEDDLSRCRMRR